MVARGRREGGRAAETTGKTPPPDDNKGEGDLLGRPQKPKVNLTPGENREKENRDRDFAKRATPAGEIMPERKRAPKM